MRVRCTFKLYIYCNLSQMFYAKGNKINYELNYHIRGYTLCDFDLSQLSFNLHCIIILLFLEMAKTISMIYRLTVRRGERGRVRYPCTQLWYNVTTLAGETLLPSCSYSFPPLSFLCLSLPLPNDNKPQQFVTRYVNVSQGNNVTQVGVAVA